MIQSESSVQFCKIKPFNKCSEGWMNKIHVNLSSLKVGNIVA